MYGCAGRLLHMQLYAQSSANATVMELLFIEQDCRNTASSVGYASTDAESQLFAQYRQTQSFMTCAEHRAQSTSAQYLVTAVCTTDQPQLQGAYGVINSTSHH